MSTLAARAALFEDGPRPPESLLMYPDSDGEPMADNSRQYERIVTTKGNLDQMVAHFVAGNLLWYPVQGHPEIRFAPDVFVALGRPKGHRSSYLQWREDNIAPRVVFEFWSPGNTLAEFIRKFDFYLHHGVDEFYVYDEDRGYLGGWIRNGSVFHEVTNMHGWVSPLLGCRFELVAGDLQMYRPDGSRFLSFDEMERARLQAVDEAQHARDEAQHARDEAQHARDEAQRANDRAAAMAQRLRELGIDPS